MQYDDLSTETTWTSDNDRMPQEYLDGVMAQINAIQPGKRDTFDELKAIEGRIWGRKMPRFGQPAYDAPLTEWYREYQYRISHPFWYEREYHFLDDFTCIHELKETVQGAEDKTLTPFL